MYNNVIKQYVLVNGKISNLPRSYTDLLPVYWRKITVIIIILKFLFIYDSYDNLKYYIIYCISLYIN